MAIPNPAPPPGGSGSGLWSGLTPEQMGQLLVPPGMAGEIEDDPLIFLGTKSKNVSYEVPGTRVRGEEIFGRTGEVSQRRRVRRQRRASEIADDLYDLKPKEYQAFLKRLAAAGALPGSANFEDVKDAYESLLLDVASYQAKGKKITPDDYIDNLIRLNGLDPDKPGSWFRESGSDDSAGGEEGLKPSTTVNTVRSIYDMSPEEAQATLRQHIKNLVGRDPTKAEIGDYINAVQTAARKNPTTQRQVTKYRPDGSRVNTEGYDTVATETDPEGGMTTQMSRTNEGFDEGDAIALAEERAMEAPDYGSYQAVATYFPALMQLLGSTTGS